MRGGNYQGAAPEMVAALSHWRGGYPFPAVPARPHPAICTRGFVGAMGWRDGQNYEVLMDLTAVCSLIQNLKLWRETELAAQQDVDDHEARVIAADLCHIEAKRGLAQIERKIEAIQQELADAIFEHTTPLELLFLPDEEMR
jgi:hypothetical protein